MAWGFSRSPVQPSYSMTALDYVVDELGDWPTM